MAALERMSTSTGVSKTELIGRITVWLESQPREVQSAITHSQGDAASEIVRLKMAEMAAAGTGAGMPTDVQPALELMRQLIDKVEKSYANLEDRVTMDIKARKKG